MVGVSGLGAVEWTLLVGMTLLVVVGYVLPFWRILARMGFSPWLSILVLISPLNVVLFYYLAFSRWPSAPAADPPRR